MKKLTKRIKNVDVKKVQLYSTEGNSCTNPPYSGNCSC